MLTKTSMSSKLFLVVILLMFLAFISQSSGNVLLSASEEELSVERLARQMAALEERVTQLQKTMYQLISTLLDDKSDGEDSKDHAVEKRDLSHSNTTEEFEHSNEFLKLSIHSLSGLRGTPGRDGRDGAAGPPGENGAAGATGAVGSPGRDGSDGEAGLPGENGVAGATGAVGSPGRDGRDGEAGPPGENGIAGAAGAVGSPGRDGRDGEAGQPGDNGAPGATGRDGREGAAGSSGPSGPSGPSGEDGTPGATGAVGPPGKDGLPGAPGEGGDVYTRWGRTTCGNGSTLLYQGFASGSQQNQPGGGVNYQCMPLSPEHSDRHYIGSGYFSYMAGAEYEIHVGRIFPSGMHNQKVPCARCYTNDRAAVMMLPGKRTCPNQWNKEYEGFLMAGYYDHNHQTTFECMDADPVRIAGQQADTDGMLFFFVRPRCGSVRGSTHHCPPYNAVREITCVVCSK